MKLSIRNLFVCFFETLCVFNVNSLAIKRKYTTKGDKATLTYFTDSETQCYGSNIPRGNALAINPLLLGISAEEWEEKYMDVEPSKIWYCGLFLKLTVKGKTFKGRIIDTCDPIGHPFVYSTGDIIGGKCDYTDTIDLYESDTTNSHGLKFLQDISGGDDFFQGKVKWSLLNSKGTIVKCKNNHNNTL